MKKIIVSLFVAMIALPLAGCGNSVTVNDSNPSSQAAPSAATSGQVLIKDLSFSPESLTVKQGATVTWTNNDAAPHQISSELFDSPTLSKGESFSFVFSDQGSYSYACSIHPSMKGKIIVE